MTNELTGIDFAEILGENEAKAAQLRAIAVTQENCINLEAKRTEANKEIKDWKAKIEAAKKEYLKPFAALEKQALDAIKPYEDAAKEFSGAILEAKKARKQAKLKEIYQAIAFSHVDEDGCIPAWMPTFEQAIEGITQSTTEALARDLIKARIENSQKSEFRITLKGSKANMEKVKSFAIGIGCDWKEE